MRVCRLSHFTLRLTGGTDGDGGGSGPLVILLHGFGAAGDDLVPLADVVAAPTGTRWLFPEGPLNLGFGYGDSRAWWMIDMARIQADREAGRVRDLSQDIPKGLAPIREKVRELLQAVEQELGADPRHTVLGGFSQGAMLSCDTVLHSDRLYAGLILLSGNLLAEPVWGPLMPARASIPVFQSHGVQDAVLPYVGAERLRDALTYAGFTVDWHRFRGGHEIPEMVLERLGVFLNRVLTNVEN